MILWLFRIVVIFAILTLIYVALSRYYRWDRARELRTEFDAGEAGTEDRDAHIAQGLSQYDRSLKKKLVFGVYLVPLAAIALLLFVANNM